MLAGCTQVAPLIRCKQCATIGKKGILLRIDERNILIDSLQPSVPVPKRGIHRVSAWLHAVLENNKPKTTIAALDGVRAIACLAVVMFHIGGKVHIWDTRFLGHNAISIIMAGDGGVALFFVLSGFLL